MSAGAPPDTASGIFISEVLPRLSRGEACPTPTEIAEIVKLYRSGKINIVSARRLVGMITEESGDAEDIARRYGLLILRDPAIIRKMVSEVVSENPQVTEDVRRGKLSAMKAIVGQVMRRTRGCADPSVVNAEVEGYFRSDRDMRKQ